MAGRTLSKFMRAAIDGYELSGYLDSVNPMTWAFDMNKFVAWTDPAIGYLPGMVHMAADTITGILDNTVVSGLHVTASGQSGVKRIVSVALGQLAAPVQGDPVFCVQQYQTTYAPPVKDGMVPVTLKFALAEDAVPVGYSIPWGQVLNWNTARTAANAANGVDNIASLVSTAFGGFFVYHVLGGNGTATLSVDDSANNSTWLALAGATSGSIDCSVVSAGIVPLGLTATVRRYLRWQLALGTATTVTFCSSFIRAFHA